MGPLIALHFVHNGIRRELTEFETAVDQLSTGTSPAMDLQTRFAQFEQWLRDHEEAEEDILFPAVDERAPRFIKLYEMDHRSNDVFMDSIRENLQQLSSGASSTQLRQLQRDTVALRATMLLHLQKEDEHLVGLAGEVFSPPEQGQLVGQLANHMPKERWAAGHSWLFARLAQSDRESLLRIMQAGAPAPAYEAILGVVSQAVPPAEWAELRARAPELIGSAVAA